MVFAEVCIICKELRSAEEEEKMLVCDGCDYQCAHADCLMITVEDEQEWFCKEC